jgi:hypothetical protein
MTRARESLHERALRLIAERRLAVVLVDGERVEVRVQGTTAEHLVTYERGGWQCDCEAARFARRCSHLHAAQLVCRRPERQPAGPGRLTSARMLAEQHEASRVRAGSTRRTA